MYQIIQSSIILVLHLILRFVVKVRDLQNHLGALPTQGSI